MIKLFKLSITTDGIKCYPFLINGRIVQYKSTDGNVGMCDVSDIKNVSNAVIKKPLKVKEDLNKQKEPIEEEEIIEEPIEEEEIIEEEEPIEEPEEEINPDDFYGGW